MLFKDFFKELKKIIRFILKIKSYIKITNEFKKNINNYKL